MHSNINKSDPLHIHPPSAARLRWHRMTDKVLRHFTWKKGLIAGGVLVAVAAASYATLFFWPRQVAFLYTGEYCFTNPVLLPNLISNNQSRTYRAVPQASLRVAGYPLYARTTCLTPIASPKERTTETIAFGTALFKKPIRVSNGKFPALASQAALETRLSIQDPLVLKLSQTDHVFDYELIANDKHLPCAKDAKAVVCDVAKLQLTQSATYKVSLERQFNDKPAGMVFERSLLTVESVHVTGASLTPDQTITDAPSEFTLTLNRPAAKVGKADLYLNVGAKREPVAVKTGLKDNTLIVHFDKPLARSASFVFVMESLEAADGGFLPATYALPFKTSGGPKVTSVNIGSSKVSTLPTIVISFDTNVSTAQNIAEAVRLELGGVVASTVSVSGNKVTIKPTNAFPKCTTFSVKVLDSLQNNFGIAGGSAWSFKARTLCQTIFSIGTSVQGRAILGYSFGSGPSKIVFVGTTHGDEKSSTSLLNSWINYLEASGNVPAHRTIVIIPNVNPDGYAMNRRTNANNVDLNRNFGANNWKSGVTMPDKSYNATGGGTAPLSEPESRALANYVLSVKPRLVLTYHATGGVVIPNDSGDSVSLAHTYDSKSNVYFAANAQTATLFEYDTTGAFEDWLHDKPGIAALLIELQTKTGNEYAKHLAALVAMMQLP